MKTTISCFACGKRVERSDAHYDYEHKKILCQSECGGPLEHSDLEPPRLDTHGSPEPPTAEPATPPPTAASVGHGSHGASGSGDSAKVTGVDATLTVDGKEIDVSDFNTTVEYENAENVEIVGTIKDGEIITPDGERFDGK